MPAAPPDDLLASASPQRWLDEHGDALYRYARTRERDTHKAEDLVQETLLAAWGARESFEGTSGERAWLMGILRHKAVDAIRRAGRRPEVALPDGADASFDDHGRWRRRVDAWGGDPGAALRGAEFERAVEGCREELPVTLGEVFTRRYGRDERVGDIAEALRVTAGSVSVRLHRARLAMRACLSARWLDGEDR